MNKTMLQYFEWYLPEDENLWLILTKNAKKIKESGITTLWLPPAYKGASGNKSVGYDVYDVYDLGEFDQKGSIATKYGTRSEYLNCVKVLQREGVEVLADIVLNHMMGADEKESVMARETSANNREEIISDEEEIEVWTKFNFAGRNGKYSRKTWDASNFSGVDYDAEHDKNGIFLFDGKEWNDETSDEYGNYDYLMGADLDFANKDTLKAVTKWGKWYLRTVKMDGFRLDAVKHISAYFYKDWLKILRRRKNLFAVGEYWQGDVNRLEHYLSLVDHSLSLFDVPLHFMFYDASHLDDFDFSKILNGTLLEKDKEHAVTFVDNHDSQPGQSLESFVSPWFKPHAYALILFLEGSYPCVFYGDLYGIPHDSIPPVNKLKEMIKIRELYAYGKEIRYFDDRSIIGFVRQGDKEHKGSGIAVIMSIREEGTKIMDTNHPNTVYIDINTLEKVETDDTGKGVFHVANKQLGLYIQEEVFREIINQ